MSLADDMMIRAYTLSKDELKMMADQVVLPKNKGEVRHINHLEDRMYRNPKTNRQVMTTTQVRETLAYTNNFLTACGDNYQLKVKEIGAGMKEVTLIPY